MWSKIYLAVSLILNFIGLGGMPDDLRTWRDAMNWVSSNLPIACDFTGNCGRWVFVLTGMIFLVLGVLTHKPWARKLRDCWGKFAHPRNLTLDDKPILTIQGGTDIGDADAHDMRFEGQDGGTCVWYLEIHNASSDTDAQAVEVKVESYDKIDDLLKPTEKTPRFTQSGIVLPFKRGGQSRVIRAGDRESVRFVSFCKNIPKRWLQIGDYSDHTFDTHDKIVSPYEPYRIDLTIRASNSPPASASFFVHVEHDLLTVRRL